MAETYIYGAYDTKPYSNHWRARIGYTYTQDASAKTSTVTLKLYVYNGYTSQNNVANQAYYKLMDNTTHYQTYNFTSAKKWQYIASTTKTVTHDASGKGSLAVNGTWCSGMSSATYTPYTLTVSGTITFKDIPVASTVSATNANIGSASTISIKAFSTTYKHTLSYKINNGAYTEIATNVGSSYSWTLPNSLNDVLSAAATKLGMTIKCETFNGSTSLGTTTCSLTGYAVEAVLRPVLSATIVDTNSSAIALTGDSSKLIKYYSNAQITTTATAYGNASIASYKIVNGSKSITSATGTINAVESNKFTISATDTRGFTTTISLEPEMVNYVKPQLSLKVEVVSPAQGTIHYDLDAKYFTGSFGGITNTVTKKLQYKGENEDTWHEISLSNDSGEAQLDYRQAQQVKAVIYDKIYTTPAESAIFKVVFEPAFYWNNDEFIFNQDTIIANGFNITEALNSLFYQDGDTITINNGAAAGYITTKASYIAFSIPLGKNTSKINSVSLTTLEVAIRQNGQYLWDGKHLSSTGTAGAMARIIGQDFNISARIQEGALKIGIQKYASGQPHTEANQSAFTNADKTVTATNNDVVGIQFNLGCTLSSSASSSSTDEEVILEVEDGEDT